MIKKIFGFALGCALLIQSQYLSAEEKIFELKPNEDFRFEVPLSGVSDFFVSRESGDINFVGNSESAPQFIVRGRFKGGSEPASLKVTITPKRQFKIEVIKPNSGGTFDMGGMTIHGDFSGTIITGRNITMRNGVIVSGEAQSISVGSGTIDLTVEAPKTLVRNLKLETNGGNLKVLNLDSDGENAKTRQIVLETKGGNISGESLKAGDGIIFETSGGNLSISNSTAPIDLKTNGGAISASGNSGNLRARTSGGQIMVSGHTGRVDSKTSGGNILHSNPNSTSERAKTSGGSVSGLRAGCGDEIRELNSDDRFNF